MRRLIRLTFDRVLCTDEVGRGGSSGSGRRSATAEEAIAELFGQDFGGGTAEHAIVGARDPMQLVASLCHAAPEWSGSLPTEDPHPGVFSAKVCEANCEGGHIVCCGHGGMRSQAFVEHGMEPAANGS